MSIFMTDDFRKSFEQRAKMVMDNAMHIYEEEERASFLRFIAGVRAGNNWEDELSLLQEGQGVRSRDVVVLAIDLVTKAPVDGTVRQIDLASHNRLRSYWGKQCEAVNVRIRAEHDDIFEVAKKFEEAAEAASEREHKAAVKELKKANRRRGLEAVPVTPPVPVVVAAPVAAVPTAPDTTAVDLEVELANQAARRLKSVTPKTVRKLTVPEPPAVGAPVAPGDITPDETRRVERRRLRDTARIEARRHRENEQRQKAKNEYNMVRNALGASFAVERLQPVSDPIAVIEQGLSAALAADAKRVKAKAKAQASAEARAEAEEVHTCIFR